MTKPRILFLGETYRADAQTWIIGIEKASSVKVETAEIKTIRVKPIRALQSIGFIFYLLYKRFFFPDYDIILAERSTSYGFFSLFVKAKVRVVAQQGISDIFPNTFSSRIYKKILQKLVYKNVDIVHAWGNAMVPAMIKSGTVPSKIIVCPKGIDLNIYKVGFDQGYYKGNRIRAIVTRSLLPEYNHSVLLDAIHQLKSEGIDVALRIIGDGPLLPKLKQQVLDLQIDDLISFGGRIPNHELPIELGQSNLYLSVPITEGASSSLMEAMASGLYPIVTKLPGNMSFIKDNVNGKLVEVGSVQSLMSAIRSYCEMNIYDITDAVIKNRKWVEQFCDRDINMNYFWSKYMQIHSIKKNLSLKVK